MLSAESRTKLQQPGLRMQGGLAALPVGSRIAVAVLTVMALLALLAPLIAPNTPHPPGLVPPARGGMNEVGIAGVGKTVGADNAIPPNAMFWTMIPGSRKSLYSYPGVTMAPPKT